MHSHVLQLDIQGTPQAWIGLEDAAHRYASGAVVWEDGASPLKVLRGGVNVATGRQSTITVFPIIAVRGQARVNLFDVTPAVSKSKLLRRDRNTCAYCAGVFQDRDLQCEHIVPQSRGGEWSWMNLVAACRLSPPKTLPIERVSELRPLTWRADCGFGTRGRHQFGLRVRGRAR